MSNISLNHTPSAPAASGTTAGSLNLIYFSLYVLSTTGILGSLLIIILSIFSSKLKGDFKYFICNVAFTDLIAEFTWLLWLLSARFFPTDLPLSAMIVLAISMFGSYLTALTAPLPATLSRFILFRKHTGIVLYRRFFNKKQMLFYFLICDCYPYFLAYMANQSKSYTVQLLFIVIFMSSFIILYIFVGFVSLTLFGVMKKQADAEERLRIGEFEERKEVAKAFLFLGIVPLCCQFFHLIYACTFIYAIFWGAETSGAFWRFLQVFLTYALMYGIAINPLIDILVVFFVIKPYKTALLSAIEAVSSRLKPHNGGESHDTIDTAILQADRYQRARRSTLREPVVVGHE